MYFSDEMKVVDNDEKSDRSVKIKPNERLSEYLMRKGVLTAKQLKQLQCEFSVNSTQLNEAKTYDVKANSNRKTKKSTKKRK